MESPKYLIIITLIDGQNFTLPDGAPERVEAHVFAEARFGNESVLKSDPIKLTNSNPEFVTELAWQLDKRNLHQLRIERKSIKLQIYLQTQEKKKVRVSQNNQSSTNGVNHIDSSSSHKVELIGYTIIDIRSAQETDQPKFQWVPLLNPKFRKSVYNRPEIQMALALSRVDEDVDKSKSTLNDSSSLTTNGKHEDENENPDERSESHETYDLNETSNSKMYKTCLDFTLNQSQPENHEILEYDIQIKSIDGCFYLYDARNTEKSTIQDCIERYDVTVTIPFNSELDSLTDNTSGVYYFSITLFGTSLKTASFKELTSVETKEVQYTVYTPSIETLRAYLELNSSLVIKLHKEQGPPLGLATVQLDQLCGSETSSRSIEGIFALQSFNDNDMTSNVRPTIGVTVLLEKVNEESTDQINLTSDEHIEMTKEHFGVDIDEYLFKNIDDTHQLTTDDIRLDDEELNKTSNYMTEKSNNQDNHHFCFTIDLKNFSYTSSQRLIPTLRELVVRYSYPFFGYKETITTDASIPISSTNSIIVSGFCEFNFATTIESLLAAFKEIPLDLDILTCDHINLNLPERVVATCCLNIAQTMCLNEENLSQLKEKHISTTVSTPIYSLDNNEIGELQVFLCLKDLGEPKFNFKETTENPDNIDNYEQTDTANASTQMSIIGVEKLESFIEDAKKNFELWKEDFIFKFTEEARKRENERFRRLYQRFEVRESKRDQEHRKKMEELKAIEKKLRSSFEYLDSYEKIISNNFNQLKVKDETLDSKIEKLDLKVTRFVSDMRTKYERGIDSLPTKLRHSYEDNTNTVAKQAIKCGSKISTEVSQVRRSSLKNPSNVAAIPIPVRSSSSVRTNDGIAFKFIKRPTGVVTTVVNGANYRPRSNSTRLTLSKETQEKLSSLRREKAELLKRGCKPNDELIQEINSMIEKLAC